MAAAMATSMEAATAPATGAATGTATGAGTAICFGVISAVSHLFKLKIKSSREIVMDGVLIFFYNTVLKGGQY